MIRAAEGEVKAVIQWQPCNNLEVQAAAEQPELTVRDAWEGEQHEVLPGTLPLPTPPVADPQPAEQAPEAVTADIPALAEEPAMPAPVMAEASAPIEAMPAAPAFEAPVVAQEPVKPETPAAAVAAASGPSRRRSTTTSRSANGSKPSNGTARTKVVAAAATEVRERHDMQLLQAVPALRFVR